MIFTTVNNRNLNIVKTKSHVKLIYEDFNQERNKSNIRVTLTQDDIKKLINTLEDLCTYQIIKEDKGYAEEISTYKNEVERTLTITGDKDFNCCLDLVCYTNKPYDDNWIELTQKRLAYLIGLLYGYVR